MALGVPSEKSFEKSAGAAVEEEPVYHFEEIKELKTPTLALAEKLKEKIDGDEYDMLIGDDASGRIPTLILRQIFNRRRKELHPDKTAQENEMPVKFIVGGHSCNEKAVAQFLERIKPAINKKILLVTEFMSTGDSAAQLSWIFDEAGVDFDVAAFVAMNMTRYYKSKLGRKVFVGEERERSGHYGAPKIYGKSQLSGVWSGSDEEEATHARALAGKDAAMQRQVNEAREDVKTLANEVYQKVWG